MHRGVLPSAKQQRARMFAGTGKNRWRYRRRWWGMGAAGGYSQSAAGIQACLAQLVGAWVPQNGIIGPRTRRAVQIFQGQQQLPVTGMLDSATIAAIQSACNGQAAAPEGPEAAPPPSGANAAGPPEPPPPPDQAGPSPDAGEAEILASEPEAEIHEALQVGGPCKVEVERHPPVPFSRDRHFQWAPAAPAVYVTFIDGKPWRVGIAEHNLRLHLLHQARAVKDLNIPTNSLQNRSVGWITIRSGVASHCAIQQGGAASGPQSFHPVHSKHGILKILKQLLIKKLQTGDKGNPGIKTVRFTPGGSLVVTEKGKTIAELSLGKPL